MNDTYDLNGFDGPLILIRMRFIKDEIVPLNQNSGRQGNFGPTHPRTWHTSQYVGALLEGEVQFIGSSKISRPMLT